MDINHNIERNIVKEILRECNPKKITPNENFVAFFIKLLLLDPKWGVTDDFMTSRENVAKFIAFVISQLESKNDPKLGTLEMQFYFTCNLDNINNVVKRNRANLSGQLAPLMNRICQMNNPNSEDEIDDLTKMIIYYVTLLSGLGNPEENEVYQEALAAFNSAVDKEELKEFMGLPLADKERHVIYIMKIITGLRLYNKDCDLGGAEIFDLPSLLEKAMSTIKGEAHATLKKVIDKVYLLTTIVDRCYTLGHGEEDGYFKMVCTLPNQIKKQDIEHVKDMLIFYRQCELYIRKVMEKLENIENLSYIIYERFQCSLRETYQIMHVRVAIPTNTVFPLFETLANNWTELQNQVIVLARYRKIIVNLIGFTKNVHCSKKLLNNMLENTRPLTDVERLRKTNKFKINSLNPEVKVTKLQNFVNTSNIHLQYLGFCCWKLVETKGGLISGNPNMGVAIYKKKNFVFSTPPGCSEFSKDPESLINEVLHLGRKKPHLIHFLNIKDQLLEVLDISELSKERRLLKKMQEKKVNTKYVFRSKIHRNYYWNVWDFKKQALQMANLSKRKTISTQTHKSHFINTVNTQTYEVREKEVQTKKDNYTNVPTPSTFIFGLRGRKDDKQFILDLTRPVGKH